MDKTCSEVKETEASLLPGTSVVAGMAHSGLRGWRLRMEDAVVAELLSPSLGCFAVLDGHGGEYCSRWGSEQLPQRLQHVASCVDAATDADEARQVAQQLSDAVRQMDADLRGLGRPAWACGSTLVVLLVTRRSLTVANLGDSRAVLCRGGSALPLSKDHKPRNQAERQRIVDAGGSVIDGRVNGDLSLSRALGDFRHKCVPSLPPAKQPVSAEPEVRCTNRLRTDHFALLACDGVWDVMTSADAVAFVANAFERAPATPAGERGSDAEAQRRGTGRVVELLLDECLRRGSTDNISAVLVLLDPSLRVRPALLQSLGAASGAGAPLASVAECSRVSAAARNGGAEPTRAPPPTTFVPMPPPTAAAVWPSRADGSSPEAKPMASVGSLLPGGIALPARTGRRALLLAAVLACMLLLLRSAATVPSAASTTVEYRRPASSLAAGASRRVGRFAAAVAIEEEAEEEAREAGGHAPASPRLGPNAVFGQHERPRGAGAGSRRGRPSRQKADSKGESASPVRDQEQDPA